MTIFSRIDDGIKDRDDCVERIAAHLDMSVADYEQLANTKASPESAIEPVQSSSRKVFGEYVVNLPEMPVERGWKEVDQANVLPSGEKRKRTKSAKANGGEVEKSVPDEPDENSLPVDKKRRTHK